MCEKPRGCDEVIIISPLDITAPFSSSQLINDCVIFCEKKFVEKAEKQERKEKFTDIFLRSHPASSRV